MPRPKTENKARIRALRFTDADWLKLKSLGGAKWIRLAMSKIKNKNVYECLK